MLQQPKQPSAVLYNCISAKALGVIIWQKDLSKHNNGCVVKRGEYWNRGGDIESPVVKINEYCNRGEILSPL